MPSNPRRSGIAIALAGFVGLACAAAVVLAQQPAPPGADKSTTTRALEAGARLLQGNAPPARMDIHLSGFHSLKGDPAHQMSAHHFCQQLNEDFAQCALFDGSGPGARLNGVEYIVSERLFATLPEAERRFWHPHNGEILSGQLVAPGIPEPAERALMRQKINSYGKTWHVWNTGATAQRGDALPLGEPRLAWSFSRDGELRPGLLEDRDRALGIDSAERRRGREELRPLAKPQAGVDALRAAFPGARDIPGVVDQQRAAAPAAPASR
jgi:hypothetical protein